MRGSLSLERAKTGFTVTYIYFYFKAAVLPDGVKVW